MNAATFSDDGVYRYWLCRVLNPYPKGRERRLVWVMLNPSTAERRSAETVELPS
jgi:hypothetical protein